MEEEARSERRPCPGPRPPAWLGDHGVWTLSGNWPQFQWQCRQYYKSNKFMHLLQGFAFEKIINIAVII